MFIDDFKPQKSSSMSPCASSTSSTDDKYTDLQLETDIAMNKAPTPSPTGSSSTLSDDHPLDKNGLNLLGSETDSGVVSLNDARITDDMTGDIDGNIGDLRGSPDGAVDNGSDPNMLIRSEVNEDVDIPEGEVQSGDIGMTTDSVCWCQSGCGDCSNLQQLNSEHSSTGAVSSPLSPLSSLSSPLMGTAENKSSSMHSELDQGAAGETKGTVVYDDPNEDSEDEIYENTRHTKLLNGYFKTEPVQIVDDARCKYVYLCKHCYCSSCLILSFHLLIPQVKNTKLHTDPLTLFFLVCFNQFTSGIFIFFPDLFSVKIRKKFLAIINFLFLQ